jgi:DNA-binding transcriptional regulator YiaG
MGERQKSSLANWLAMAKRDYHVEVIANWLGVNRSTFQRWARGESAPRGHAKARVRELAAKLHDVEVIF